MPATTVDGMDVLAVETAATEAVELIRAGSGPRFIELATYRFRAHSMFDAELYRDRTEVEEWKKRSPIETLAAKLRTAGLLTDADLTKVEQDIEREIAVAVEFAENGTWEAIEDLARDVYARPNVR
jgi:TPP-dependent pyruvate/acetoin dehydrogenase alpha subunit